MRGSPSRSSQKPVSAREVSGAQNKMKPSPHTPICSAPHADPLMTGRCSNPLFSMREYKGTVSCTSSSSDSVRLDQTWYFGEAKGDTCPCQQPSNSSGLHNTLASTIPRVSALPRVRLDRHRLRSPLRCLAAARPSPLPSEQPPLTLQSCRC